MKILICISLFFCVTSSLCAQGLKAKGQSIVNSNGEEVILRGIGLGGWMLQEPYMLQLSGVAMAQHEIRSRIKELAGDENTEKFYNQWLSNHCTKADIDSLAAWGFNSVRLPMHYNLFTLPIELEPVKGKNTWLKRGFQLTDSLLSWCKANKMYLILDLHAAPGGQGNDNAIADRDTTNPSLWQIESNQHKTIALWQQLAKRYANEEWIGGYDLINEPNWGFQNTADKNGCAEELNQPLTDLLKNITSAIREVDKNHMIIIEGNCWGNNYNGMFPLWDDNMAISFHKYWNHTDQSSIQKFINYRKQYNVPVWMGESGENSNSWFTDAIHLLESNKIGWAWWPMKKMGINNPLQVKVNAGYQRMIDYWKGKGEKPSKDDVIKAIFQLAEDLKISNNIYHKDVVDAMTRQVRTSDIVPFREHKLNQSNVIFATDYDLGKLNSAYSDKETGNYWVSTNIRTEWNKGWSYRNEGVDIQPCNDSITNGYAVAWIEDGEWLLFTIDVQQAGTYFIHFRYLPGDSNGAITVFANDVIVATVQLDASTGYQWKDSEGVTLVLSKGLNRIRLRMDKGGFKLNYLQLNKITTANNK